MNKKVLSRTFSILQHIVLVSVAFIAAVPLLSCALTSIKTQSDLINTPFFSLPETGMVIQNYKTVIDSGFLHALIISMIIVIISVIISSLLNAMTAYVLCRFEFELKSLVYGLILFASFVPTLTMQVYIFDMMASANLINNLFGYIVVISGVDIVSIIIFSRYFSAIPKAIDEAAMIDGCSYFKIFFRIHIPMLRQAFFTAAIIRSIYVYNEYYIANLYLLDKSKYQTVTTLLHSFSAPFGTQYTVICAGVIMAALPTTIIFLIFQKRIYNGLTSSNKLEFE